MTRFEIIERFNLKPVKTGFVNGEIYYTYRTNDNIRVEIQEYANLFYFKYLIANGQFRQSARFQDYHNEEYFAERLHCFRDSLIEQGVLA